MRRSLSTVAAVIAISAVGGGIWAGYRWLTTSPRFAITAITIWGAHRVDPDELRAALPIRAGDNVFASLAEVGRTVRRDPWVATAQVHRILPHTIAIEIREHTAAAVVELGELYLVDGSGHPFKRAALETGEGDGLPIITGIGRASYLANPVAAAAAVQGAIAAAGSWRAGERPQIGELHVDTHGAVTLHTYDPAIAIQLGALGAGLSDAERARARAIHLDARPDHVTVAFAKD